MFEIFVILCTLVIAGFMLALAERQRSKRNRAEQALMNYQIDLENTVERRTRELAARNVELAGKNK